MSHVRATSPAVSPYRTARPRPSTQAPSHEEAAIAALVLMCLMAVVLALLSSGTAEPGVSRLFTG
jgi:hypothetical protein